MDEFSWAYAWRVFSSSWAPSLGTFGTMVAAIGAFYGSSGVALAGAVIAGSASIISAFRQAEFESQLREANTKLLLRSDDIVAIVTGSDSYAYVQVQHIASDVFDVPDKSNTVMLLAVHQGKYPLYDVSLRIYAYADAALHGDGVFLGETVSLGTIAPNSSRWVTPFHIDPAHGTRDMNLFFDARNGFWAQEIRGRKANGEWVYAWRVGRNSDDGTTEYVAEKIPPEFPREPNGEIDWGGR